MLLLLVGILPLALNIIILAIKRFSCIFLALIKKNPLQPASCRGNKKFDLKSALKRI